MFKMHMKWEESMSSTILVWGENVETKQDISLESFYFWQKLAIS